MHRAPRIARSIDAVGAIRGSQAAHPFLCYACRCHAPPFSTSAVQKAQDEALPFREKIRRRMWGTDNPPGLKDPYSKPTALNQENPEDNEVRDKRPHLAPEMSEIEGDYEPATSWDGLEVVGGIDYAARERWIAEHPFKGFPAADIVTDPEEVTAALHRALVEVFALEQAGVPVRKVVFAPEADLTHGIQVIASNDGVSLVASDDYALQNIVQSAAKSPNKKRAATQADEEIASVELVEEELLSEAASEDSDGVPQNAQPTASEEDVKADRSSKDPLEDSNPIVTYADLIASWDPSWLQVSIAKPKVKFAVIKRILQLTGLRIPDSAVTSATTAQSILSHLVAPPKQQKLADALKQKEELHALPNVKMYRQKITTINKEKSLGRWKVIQRELEKHEQDRERILGL